MKQLICSDLAIGYEGNIVQDKINFSVNKGDYICVVGKNGAGKSTLMKTVLGLLPTISGKTEMSKELIEGGIGYLPQQTQIQKDFPASVWEVVLSGAVKKQGLRLFYSREQKETALNILEKIGISDLKKKSYSKLSGGQQQKTLLARALCATGEILLLDEPVSGLDPKSTEEMYELIKKLNKEGTTVIMITHDVENSVNYADYVLSIDETVKYMEKDEFVKTLAGDKSE